uniref:Putative secreted protein n=1 Tax=Anopheles darlingi TaxID=43151 RepID=A0A2M4CJH6_ANODA
MIFFFYSFLLVISSFMSISSITSYCISIVEFLTPCNAGTAIRAFVRAQFRFCCNRCATVAVCVWRSIYVY